MTTINLGVNSNILNRLKTEMKAENVQRGPCGSYYIPAGSQMSPKWSVTGKTDFDKFVKRYALEATGEDGKKQAWTMATRGDEKKSGNVTMVVPIVEDNQKHQYLFIQEEARPIDLARNGSDSRLLAFPAGVIGDEIEGETAKDSAIRELTEETGLISDEIDHLNPFGPIPTTPGLTDEATEYYSAEIKDLKPATKALTDGVTKGWWLVPVAALYKWFAEIGKQGKIATGQTLTAIQLMLQKGKLKL